MEDLGKKLRTRFKKSKDFDKTIQKLQKEGFEIELTKIKDKRYIKILQNKKEVFHMVYQDINDFIGKSGYEYLEQNNNDYKQCIIAIYY